MNRRDVEDIKAAWNKVVDEFCFDENEKKRLKKVINKLCKKLKSESFLRRLLRRNYS